MQHEQTKRNQRDNPPMYFERGKERTKSRRGRRKRKRRRRRRRKRRERTRSTERGGEEREKRRVSRWRSGGISGRASFTREIWAVFRLDARSSLLEAYGEHRRLGCTHVRPLHASFVCVRAYARRYVRAAGTEEQLYTRCPPCAAINYRVTRYGRAYIYIYIYIYIHIYISRKTCRCRYLKSGFLYTFRIERWPASAIRTSVFTGDITELEFSSNETPTDATFGERSPPPLSLLSRDSREIIFINPFCPYGRVHASLWTVDAYMRLSIFSICGDNYSFMRTIYTVVFSQLRQTNY